MLFRSLHRFGTLTMALLLALVFAASAMAQTASLTLVKETFAPGELITCYFTAPADLPQDAWFGLIPSDVPHGDEATNDQHDTWYEYVSGRTEGNIQVYAPDTPGSYDIRLNYSDGGGAELASVTFTVGGANSLTLESTTYAPGETITLFFTAAADLPENAWVGLIPSEVPHGDEATNDQHDMAYEYVSSRTSGSMTFAAPTTPGSYDFRLNYSDSGGAELASVTFTVQGQAMGMGNSVATDQASYAPGDTILVFFTAAPGLPQDAWVGLIPSETPHGDEATNDQYDLAYEYVSGRVEGEMYFVAPSTPGSYDIRLNYSDGGGEELATVTFSVGDAASLTLDRTTFAPGESVTVYFTAPSDLPDNAWVGLIPSSTPHGDEATNDQHDLAYEYVSGRTSGSMTFSAPTTPGSYDFRLNYSDSGGDELTSVTFTVQ
ncbi:MAG: hypothetical protein D6E12_17460 [Desulfovibrio sp.]|nr:MAG: hypothetical protein D6E12_17460 [Desulfovibrio sp.]